MRLCTSLFLILNSAFLFGQNDSNIKSAASFFTIEKTKVLVVGTFHLDYPNLDVIKTEDNDKIDVLVEPKKSEMTELINYIKKFKPTKIAIEAFPEWNAVEKLGKYKKGEFREKRDERYQIGFRIANELNLDTIYSIDANSFDEDLSKLDSTFVNNLTKGYDFVSDDSLNSMYKNWFEYEKRLPTKMNLLKYFKHINSREYHQLDYGSYLVGDFKLDNNRGADLLSIWWYNRNLRIFRKLQEIKRNKKDKILLIFGNGHVSILRQLLESSPEYEFIEFDKLKSK